MPKNYCKIVYDTNGNPDSIVSVPKSVQGRGEKYCYKARSHLESMKMQPSELQNGLFYKFSKKIEDIDDETFLGIATKLKIISMDPKYTPLVHERWLAEGFALDKNGEFRYCIVDEVNSLFGTANHRSTNPNLKVDAFFRVFQLDSCRTGDEALRNYGSWADAFFQAGVGTAVTQYCITSQKISHVPRHILLKIFIVWV